MLVNDGSTYTVVEFAFTWTVIINDSMTNIVREIIVEAYFEFNLVFLHKYVVFRVKEKGGEWFFFISDHSP